MKQHKRLFSSPVLFLIIYSFLITYVFFKLVYIDSSLKHGLPKMLLLVREFHKKRINGEQEAKRQC